MTDWSGAYAGLQFETIRDGTATFFGIPNAADGDLRGLFAGYRHDYGDFVVGVEVDWMMGDGEVVSPNNFAFDIDRLVRLGVESGYDLDGVLVYATGGLAWIDFTDVFSNVFESSGYFYGLGADIRVSESVTVGAELLQHSFDNFTNLEDLEALTFGVNIAFTF